MQCMIGAVLDEATKNPRFVFHSVAFRLTVTIALQNIQSRMGRHDYVEVDHAINDALSNHNPLDERDLEEIQSLGNRTT